MENSNQLANRFREVMLNGKWIANTNLKDQLLKTTWEQATTKVSSLNTIAALARHLDYYVAGIMNVFEGGALEIRDKYSWDFTEIGSQEDWEDAIDAICTNAEKFADHVGQMSDERLDESFVNEKYGNFRRNIEAVIEHGYYHLGQISLIRKMIAESESQP